MIFELGFSDRAKEQLTALKTNKGLAKHHKAIQEAFKNYSAIQDTPACKLMSFILSKVRITKKVFEAYAEQNTPAAHRIFFYYGPQKGVISIISVERHA